jgi:hypothetical protein
MRSAKRSKTNENSSSANLDIDIEEGEVASEDTEPSEMRSQVSGKVVAHARAAHTASTSVTTSFKSSLETIDSHEDSEGNINPEDDPWQISASERLDRTTIRKRARDDDDYGGTSRLVYTTESISKLSNLNGADIIAFKGELERLHVNNITTNRNDLIEPTVKLQISNQLRAAEIEGAERWSSWSNKRLFDHLVTLNPIHSGVPITLEEELNRIHLSCDIHDPMSSLKNYESAIYKVLHSRNFTEQKLNIAAYSSTVKALIKNIKGTSKVLVAVKTALENDKHNITTIAEFMAKVRKEFTKIAEVHANAHRLGLSMLILAKILLTLLPLI